MNTKKTLPILAAVAALAIGSGTYIAMAQDTGTESAATEMQRDGVREEGRRHRGEHHGKGRHEGGRHGRHEGRGKGGRGRRGGMMREIFARVDADGDGEVTRAEIDAFRTAQVSGADTGGDGALSIEEFDTLYRQFTRTRMVRVFQRLDRDGDGVVSAAEMGRPIDRMIERMDRDGDGVLTLERGRGKRG